MLSPRQALSAQSLAEVPLSAVPLFIFTLIAAALAVFTLAGCPAEETECDGCLLGGVCFPAGVQNPANACELCVATNPTAWSPNDGVVCDDGVYCNGADTCEAGACRVHAGDPCGDDGIFCNGDERCDEEGQQCLHSGDPCEDDGEFCNGTVTCSEDAQECLDSGPPCDDDGLFCNGTETCNETNDLCEHTGNPCGANLFCDDAEDMCTVVCDGCRVDNVCYSHGELNPENPCEECDVGDDAEAWTTRHGESCDDGLYCTGVETCNQDVCETTGDPCANVGELCYEDEQACCEALVDPVCNVTHQVVRVDDCGRELEVLQSCNTCEDGRCVCNPVAQTGCGAGEKCAFFDGVTTCVANGADLLDEACDAPESGPDSCVAGGQCIDGTCLEICTVAPNSCAVSYCQLQAGVFTDEEGVGTCVPPCDVVAQDCPDDEACYLQTVTGLTSCAGIPDEAVGMGQDQTCYGPEAGSCYLNGCDEGYGANLPDNLCAFFCNPAENWLGNSSALAGDPAGVTCTSTFGDRPDGPGAGYECRFIQSFYSNADVVADDVGFCVSVAEHGTCADFDWVQLQADIDSGAAEADGYCETYPERCMNSCISLATFNAAFD